MWIEHLVGVVFGVDYMNFGFDFDNHQLGRKTHLRRMWRRIVVEQRIDPAHTWTHLVFG